MMVNGEKATHYSGYPGGVVVVAKAENGKVRALGILSGSDAKRARVVLVNLGGQKFGPLNAEGR